MSKPSHWGSLWTALPPLDETEGIRRFVDAELEETRAFVRRLLAEHQKVSTSATAYSRKERPKQQKEREDRLT
jgi:hypothetical protein